MLHLPLIALALLATAMAVSGCGGSKTTSTSAAGTNSTSTATSTASTEPNEGSTAIAVAKGTPLSRTVWITRGDAICAKTNEKLNATTARTTADFARLLPQAAIYDHVEAVELSKLVPPASMAADWNQIVANVQKFSELSAKVAKYAQANTLSEAAPVVVAANQAQKQFTAVARQDGFKVCSIA